MHLLITWVISAIALIIISYILPGIHVAGFGSALIAAVILGLINAVVRPILAILTIPITLLTLGLFLLILNVLMFWLAGSIIDGFQIDGFWWAAIGAIIYSMITGVLVSLVFKESAE